MVTLPATLTKTQETLALKVVPELEIPDEISFGTLDSASFKFESLNRSIRPRVYAQSAVKIPEKNPPIMTKTDQSSQ